MIDCMRNAQRKGLKCWDFIGSECNEMGLNDEWTQLHLEWECYFPFLDEMLRCAGCNDRIS